MTSTIPQPTRLPSNPPPRSPPRSALPPIPASKTRKSMPGPGDSVKLYATSPLPTKLRTPSAAQTKSALPSNLGISSLSPSKSSFRSPSVCLTPGSPDKTVRRTVSIASFPQPPKASRPSLSTQSSFSGNPPDSPRSVPNPRTKKKAPRIDTGAGSQLKNSKTPSLLNGSGDGKSIPNSRNSGGHASIVSPTQSRCSSAQDSYSTSATTYDDNEEGTRRGRDGVDDSTGSSNRSPKGREGKGNVLVSVRVRPDLSSGEGKNSEGEWLVDGRRSLVSYRGKEGGDYFYDNVFTTHDNNAKVYDASAKRLVRRVMEGYHGTVFAYGMTGTGKTFSMQGTATSPGVIPLAITDIFSYIRETPHREFLLRVSYLEIYNEKIHDLLSMSASGQGNGNGAQGQQQEEIKLREDSKRGVYATPLKEEIVQSPTQLLRVIARGDHSRRTSSTQFNSRSSRSHAVVQIVVESRERAPVAGHEKRAAIAPGGVRVSTLSLIDLAGSERAAESKERRAEGAHINKSLLTLGTVIARLSVEKEGKNGDKEGKHLPYRDSKLTRLLQPALSGNSLVSILCTIQVGSGGTAASSQSHTNETMNTLKFAARAKNNIVSHAKRAEESLGSGTGDAGSRVLLERYRMEIQSLRRQLENQAKAETPTTTSETESKEEERAREKEAALRHEEQMLEMQLARTALKERIEHLNRLILCSKSTGVNASLARFSSQTSPGSVDIRSLRSSVSHSTLGAGTALNRSTSLASMKSSASAGHATASIPFAHPPDDDDEMIGEFADGMASLQVQVNALQADLADKNRYISTLERRLLQARRSSHSRVSMGLNHHHHLKSCSTTSSNNDSDLASLLREKDMEIADLRLQLDDKDRMVAALRSAARQRDMAHLTGGSTNATNRADAAPTPPPLHPPPPVGADYKIMGINNAILPHHNSHSHNNHHSETNSLFSNSGAGSGSVLGRVSPNLLPPVKLSAEDRDRKRKSVDEMSRMLDEMIQDRVESGHLIKTSKGHMRVSSAGVSPKSCEGTPQKNSRMSRMSTGTVAEMSSSNGLFSDVSYSHSRAKDSISTSSDNQIRRDEEPPEQNAAHMDTSVDKPAPRPMSS
ncbi:Centromeric protein E [Trichophyton interdigitale]|uniref:Kinesin-like protein KIP2 n=1 Tax=Trichophyton interdigitale TaxID=101480 RepID=A0A9P4YKG0_9EURO|nr:Centromeric protein E [Trichophyton interdigitale]KAF3900722.1 Centromeric protein E [Trichophyton interdigitale]KAG8211580.1 Centromeric protein E [Trichophyton interdigitale]